MSISVSPHPEPQQSRRRTRVLLVDDYVSAVRSMRMLLELLGYEVAVAYDGQRALERARLWHPDVALLDLALPKLDGLSVARQLRSDPAYARMVLVCLTGWGLDEERALALSSGFDHVLVKPVRIETVEALIHEVVRVPDD
jgi:CheY-like chemotaxis protein